MLRIRLLGAVGAVSAGGELALGGPKPRALLAVLALATPRTCSSEQIIDSLWGGDPPASARNAVQVYVTALRKALRPHDVEIKRIGDGYALRGPVTADVAELEQLVSEGRASLRSGDSARSAERLAAALDLWGGYPLGGLDAPPFADIVRPLLEGIRSAALVDLAEAQLRLGDTSAAANSAQTLLADHPYDERGWIALATAHYWGGQQDLALKACRRARALLLEELGVHPTAALVEVETQILNQALPDRSTSSEVKSTAAGPAIPVLPALPDLVVGRDQLVGDVLARLKHGQRLISLVGIGGIGKTTLALSVSHRLAEEGHRVSFCSLETDVDTHTAMVRVCGVLGIKPDEDPVQTLVEAAPTGILVLDNVEQVAGLGPALDVLLGAAPDVMLVVTSRRPTGARFENTVPVPPLAPESAEQVFLEHAERVRPGISDGQADPVHALCELLDGIPLALELAAGRVRSLTPQQLLRRIQGHRASVLEGAASVVAPERHSSLGRVLREAYEALGAPGQRLFELLGSIDGRVSLELLEGSAEGWVTEFDDGLDELVASGLVSLDLDGRAQMRGPIREFAHSLGPRSDLDLRLRQQAIELAHRLAPGLFGVHAGEVLGELRRDEDTLMVALTRAAEAGDAAAAGALAIDLNRYWLMSGRLVEGRRWIQLASAVEGHGHAVSTRLAILAGTYASYLNDPDTATTLETALVQAGNIGLPADRLVVNGWCCLAAFAAHHGDFPVADRAAHTAAHLASTSGDPGLIALARDIDGYVAAYTGDRERSLAANISGVADARRAGDTYDVVNLLINAAGDLLYLGRLDEAISFSDEAFDLTVNLDVAHPLLVAVLLIRGSVHVVEERAAAARGILLEALRLARDRYPDPLVTADILYTLGACASHGLADREACWSFGAAEALYNEHRLTAEVRLAAPIVGSHHALRDRLGEDTFHTLTALGAADPDHAIGHLLDRST